MKAALFLLAAACMASGCASLYSVQQEDARRLIQAGAGPDGARVGINLAALRTGYLQAWREAPGKMTAATLADAVAGILAGYAANELLAGEDGTDAAADQPAPGPRVIRINGDGNRVTIRE